MPKQRTHILMSHLVALSLGALAAGLSGCNQNTEPAVSGEESVPGEATAETALVPGAKHMGEGRWLRGAELEAYRRAFPPDEPARDREAALDGDSPAPAAQNAAPAAKSAAYDYCLIDFNSVQGLNYMEDKAYIIYAGPPYYTQPCNLSYATVRPVGRQYYYLQTEATGTCPGAFGMMGYGVVGNCQNQKAASLFPRYAGNGSTTDGALGLRVSIQNGSGFPFNLYQFFARSGNIKVTVTYANGGTKTYDNIAVAPGFFAFKDARNIVEATFYSADLSSVFYLDNILIQRL